MKNIYYTYELKTFFYQNDFIYKLKVTPNIGGHHIIKLSFESKCFQLTLSKIILSYENYVSAIL